MIRFFRPAIRRGDGPGRGPLDLHLHVKSAGTTTDHLLVRRASKRAEQDRVVDRLQQVGLALGIGPQQRHSGRRSLQLAIDQVPIAPTRPAFEDALPDDDLAGRRTSLVALPIDAIHLKLDGCPGAPIGGDRNPEAHGIGGRRGVEGRESLLPPVTRK